MATRHMPTHSQRGTRLQLPLLWIFRQKLADLIEFCCELLWARVVSAPDPLQQIICLASFRDKTADVDGLTVVLGICA